MSECRPFSSFPLAILPRSCLNWSVFVCLCEWKCTLMNALMHCQLAECRPWRHCCSVTYTNMGMTRASFITISLSVLPSSPYFSPPSVLGHFYFVPFTLIIHVFFEYPFASFSLSVSFHTSLSHLYFCTLVPVFSLISLFVIHYDVSAICLLFCLLPHSEANHYKAFTK